MRNFNKNQMLPKDMIQKEFLVKMKHKWLSLKQD